MITGFSVTSLTAFLQPSPELASRITPSINNNLMPIRILGHNYEVNIVRADYNNFSFSIKVTVPISDESKASANMI